MRQYFRKKTKTVESITDLVSKTSSKAANVSKFEGTTPQVTSRAQSKDQDEEEEVGFDIKERR